MRLLISRFRSTDRWDAKYFRQMLWPWPEEELTPFGNVAQRRIEAADETRLATIQPKVGSIHFDGSVTVRKTDIKALKGPLFLAHSGDVVYSKIDARNGAIGVIPDELGHVVFTAEFPIYDVTTLGKVRPGFIKLLCRTPIFRSKVNALVVGHSGRKRVAPELLETLLIPAPDISEQDRILDYFQGLMTEAQTIAQRIDKIESSIPNIILNHLGITPISFKRIQRPFITHFKDLDRWSVGKAMLAAQGISEDIEGLYPVRRLGDPEVSAVSYGIPKSPSNRPGKNARPYLRVANVQEANLDLNEIKYIDVPDNQMDGLRLEYGDLLLCEGNIEALVGRPALWRNEIADCVHQNHIIKVRINKELLHPEFVLAYMNTPPARLYFLGRAKRTTNLASINGTDVREMPIPIPPKVIQERIISETDELRAQINKLRSDMERTVECAQRVLETWMGKQVTAA